MTSDSADGCAAAAAACAPATLGPAVSGISDDLGWALATVLRAYARRADHAMASLPGGARGYRLLSAVARDCPRSQLALAHQVGLDRTVVTYLVDDLEADGLVERQADPADRRTRRVVATEAGRNALEQLDSRLRAVEGDVLGALSASDTGHLRHLLQRVAVDIAAAGEPATCPVIEDLAVT